MPFFESDRRMDIRMTIHQWIAQRLHQPVNAGSQFSPQVDRQRQRVDHVTEGSEFYYQYIQCRFPDRISEPQIDPLHVLFMAALTAKRPFFYSAAIDEKNELLSLWQITY